MFSVLSYIFVFFLEMRQLLKKSINSFSTYIILNNFSLNPIGITNKKMCVLQKTLNISKIYCTTQFFCPTVAISHQTDLLEGEPDSEIEANKCELYLIFCYNITNLNDKYLYQIFGSFFQNAVGKMIDDDARGQCNTLDTIICTLIHIIAYLMRRGNGYSS